LSTLPAYVLDTSVAVKWFANEGGADQAKADLLLDTVGKGQCILRAPEFLLFELANALMLSHKFPSARVINSIVFLQKLKIEVEPLNPATLIRAVEIASSCNATIYDSYFLALALESGSLLVTADEVFLRKVRRLPNTVSLRLLQLTERTP
jgi:predicted nucleic acid-binding protein